MRHLIKQRFNQLGLHLGLTLRGVYSLNSEEVPQLNLNSFGIIQTNRLDFTGRVPGHPYYMLFIV